MLLFPRYPQPYFSRIYPQVLHFADFLGNPNLTVRQYNPIHNLLQETKIFAFNTYAIYSGII